MRRDGSTCVSWSALARPAAWVTLYSISVADFVGPACSNAGRAFLWANNEEQGHAHSSRLAYGG